MTTSQVTNDIERIFSILIIFAPGMHMALVTKAASTAFAVYRTISDEAFKNIAVHILEITTVRCYRL